MLAGRGEAIERVVASRREWDIDWSGMAYRDRYGQQESILKLYTLECTDFNNSISKGLAGTMWAWVNENKSIAKNRQRPLDQKLMSVDHTVGSRTFLDHYLSCPFYFRLYLVNYQELSKNIARY